MDSFLGSWKNDNVETLQQLTIGLRVFNKH